MIESFSLSLSYSQVMLARQSCTVLEILCIACLRLNFVCIYGSMTILHTIIDLRIIKKTNALLGLLKSNVTYCQHAINYMTTRQSCFITKDYIKKGVV